MWMQRVGVDKNPLNPTRPTKPPEPIARPSARKPYSDGYGLGFFYFSGFRMDIGFHIFGRVDTRPPDQLNL